MKIVLVEYDPEWSSIYEKEKQLLQSILDGMELRIEHIGSTSVKGLGAKPIIDVMPGLRDFERDKDELVKRMKDAGYNYVDKFEDVMPYRRYFNKPGEGKITSYHIHCVGIGGYFWTRHLAFRNYLREFDDVRDEYFRVKKELSLREWGDSNDYALAKTDFIVPTQEKAMEYYGNDK